MRKLRFRDPGGRAVPFLLAGLAAILLAVPASLWMAAAPGDLDQYERLGLEIGCQCGTCPNRPIATCGCAFADRMLVQLREAVDSGETDDEIVAGFVASYGQAARIKPATSGLDLAAWFAPVMLLLGGGVGVAAVLAHWREQTRAGADEAATPPSGAPADESPGDRPEDPYLAQVERELGDLPE